MKIYLSVEKLKLLDYYKKLGFVDVDNYNLENQTICKG